MIFDPAAAGLPVGVPLTVVETGLAPFEIIDLFNFGPLNYPAPSILAAGGQTFSITGSFAVVPEPSSALLLSIGMIAIAALIRRR